MADPTSLLHPNKLLRTPSPKAPNYFYSLLFKLAFFAVFIALLPLFPSEFVGETISPGIWELLRLLFVGIAISYGLFSRRNVDADADKEPLPPQKAEHIPSVFNEDEFEESKVQTWSFDGSSNGNRAGNKPILLPLRSLKLHSKQDEFADEASNGRFCSVYGTKEMLDTRNGSKELVVLPSPIPWRSRSAKMEDIKHKPARSYSLPTAFDPGKLLPQTATFHPPAAHPHVSSASPPPQKLSSSPSLPSEFRRVKNGECMVKKMSNYKSIPQPPPPPPPLPANLSHGYPPATSERKMTRFNDESKDLSKKGSYKDAVLDQHVMSVAKPRIGMEVQSAAMDGATKTAGYPTEKRDEFMDKVVASTVDDSDADNEGEEEVVEAAAKDGKGENEVDKKAGEFIAKFREQIRLQRIECIKRSTRQRSSNRKTQ
ncbi:hypothetical protein Cni_G08967 [Canna indica]|uniref:Hydroxyproline-rich glycoprotein family protein n=1 Tax=Canna indica TaxID=4628 RepID=A0AAQ3Q7A5_9LILI|nr:hypothetical protein Cni_G08967 [Canna indica]